MSREQQRQWLRDQAARLGFETVGFAPVSAAPHHEHYSAWLARGDHADMAWMASTHEVRVNPLVRMEGAKTVMALALSHAWDRPAHPGGLAGRVARYAWGRDYHNLIGKRLKKLKRAFREADIQGFGGVDTAPILERDWAWRAGLGAIGKNTLCFVPGSHSWRFLAVLVLDADVAEPVEPVGDHCKSCTRCLVACPTSAFRGPFELDARRCISYWTIEAKEVAPEPLRAGFKDWVYGCDVCQEVCPHNHHPPDTTEPDFLPRHAWLDLPELLASDDQALDDRFLGTPLRRPKPHGLKRNAAIVLGNLGEPEGLGPLHDHGLTHSSIMVQQASRWAIDQLTGGTV